MLLSPSYKTIELSTLVDNKKGDYIQLYTIYIKQKPDND